MVKKRCDVVSKYAFHSEARGEAQLIKNSVTAILRHRRKWDENFQEMAKANMWRCVHYPVLKGPWCPEKSTDLPPPELLPEMSESMKIKSEACDFIELEKANGNKLFDAGIVWGHEQWNLLEPFTKRWNDGWEKDRLEKGLAPRED